MKFFKFLLLFFLIALVGILIYVSSYPGNYDIVRDRIIKAPIAHTFNTVNDLKTWEKWGAWHEEDSTIVVTYGDKTVGIGASDSWTSKDGPGKMETVALVPNQSINQKISFMDNDPNDIYWSFEEVDEGTKVTWGMKANDSPFMFKLIAFASGGWEKMFGPMQEKGLQNLEELVLNTIPATPEFRLSDVVSKETTEATFIGYPHKTAIDHEKMNAVFLADIPKVIAFANDNNLKPEDYVIGAVNLRYDEAANETEFCIGLLLNKEVKPAEGMETIKLPGGKVLMISKFGNYGTGDIEAHTAIYKYITDHNLTMKSPVWELYVNDPYTVKPEDIQTDIYYPIN